MITKEYICLKMKLGLIFIFIDLFIPHACYYIALGMHNQNMK